MITSDALKRLWKYTRVLFTPHFYPALARGVVPAIEHDKVLHETHPKTIIDIGANKGQFSLAAQHVNPGVKIFAFEPLPDERATLEKVIPKNLVSFLSAVGKPRGKAQFHVTSRPDSSSLFAPTTAQEQAYAVTEQRSIEVDVGYIQDHVSLAALEHPILLKIDVQGGELNVLESLGDEIQHIDHIYCEASFVHLYKDQPLASEICSYLIGRNFQLRSIHNVSTTAAFGQTQADFHFERGSSEKTRDY
jgi:FkbM family methyltransferase